MCMISTDPYDYKFSSFGEITVKSIDDKDELGMVLNNKIKKNFSLA